MNRSRITITIKKDLLKNLDSLIDGVDIKNRSHAIEVLLSKFFPENRIVKAVILAGGKGVKNNEGVEVSRILGVYNDKYFIEHIFDWFKKENIGEVTILGGNFSSDIKNKIGDGSKYGLQISYISRDSGTANAIKYLKGIVDENFLVMNGDVCSDMNLNKMFEFHRGNNSPCTIGVISKKEPSLYGNIILDGNNIVDFVEKPKFGEEESYLVSSGIYIMSPEVFNYINSDFMSLERDLFPFLAKEGKLYGYSFSEKWFTLK